MKSTKSNFRWLLMAVTVMIAALALSACGTAKTGTPTVDPALPVVETPFVLEGAKTTDSGLQYLELAAGTGASPKVGDVISMNYIASLPDGTELANTYTMGTPATAVWGKGRLLVGWEEGLGMMKSGGKAKMVLPPSLAFGEEGSNGIPANTPIVIEVELLSVKTAPIPTAYTADQLTKTTSGLEYIDLVVGTGAEAKTKDTVANVFTLWVKTDTGYDYIESNESGDPLTFVIGTGDVVFPGWDEGTIGMKVGGKRLLVIPAALGLGETGGSGIPANAVIVMEISLTDVKEPRKATVVDPKDYVTTASGLKYYDITPGTGASPVKGQTVVVHYTGWLEDGTQFDSSIDSGSPFSFKLGEGNVIAGWDEGLLTMKVGGKRQLVIPASLGYKETGSGTTIPPNATLIFDVELVEIQP